jgi:hypothetical protein
MAYHDSGASTEVALSPDVIAQLRNNTFAVVDDFLPLDLADQLVSDAEALNSDGHFKQHYFQFGTTALAKPAVYELDLSAPDDDFLMRDMLNSINLESWRYVIDDIGPAFVKKVDDLEKIFNNTATAMINTPPLSLNVNARPAIKIQLNKGGGSFPWHYDNPGMPNQRALTCVVYLNPRWKSGDGGEIVLWPFLSKPTTIPPIHRRAVLFYSDRVLHRVLPSRARRLCFTIWSQGTNVNLTNDVALSKDVLQFTSYDEAAVFFARSPLQRVVSRAVYSEEYLHSLLECIAGSREGREEGRSSEGLSSSDKEKVIQQQHDASVMSIVSKLRPLIDEFRRRKDSIAHHNNI